MTDLLIEFYGEEIPVNMQHYALLSLRDFFLVKISKLKIKFRDFKVHSTPRRLCLVIEGLSEHKKNQAIERKSEGYIELSFDLSKRLVKGSSLSQVETIRDCYKKEKANDSTSDSTSSLAIEKKKNRGIRDILPELLKETLHEFKWPKSMRWNVGIHSWIRPIHSGLCIFDGKPLSFFVPMGRGNDLKINFSDLTRGHRFLKPSFFSVKDFSEYYLKLKESFVLIKYEDRYLKIKFEINKLEKEIGIQARLDEKLLVFLASSVEWPIIYLGEIKKSFMNLPEEVIMSVIKRNSYLLPFEDKEGHLVPYFAIISGLPSRDGGKTIISGNEHALDASLADAEYFYYRDSRKSLKEHGKKLDSIIFHEKLGSYAQKLVRIQSLATSFSDFFFLKKKTVCRASLLLKNDLATEMVNEFPELKGVIGKNLALLYGESKEIAQSLYENYLPRKYDEIIPLSPLGCLLSLVDRIDTLTGFFFIGIQPTGSKDPFFLKRITFEIILVLRMEGASNLILREIFSLAYNLYSGNFVKDSLFSKESIMTSLKNFLLERLKNYWINSLNLKRNFIEAILSLNNPLEYPILALEYKIVALQSFFKKKSKLEIISIYKRISNILKIHKKSENSGSYDCILSNLVEFYFKKSQLGSLLEIKILEVLLLKNFKAKEFMIDNSFIVILENLELLSTLINRLFRDILIETGEASLRKNRFRILSLTKLTLDKIANFEFLFGVIKEKCD